MKKIIIFCAVLSTLFVLSCGNNTRQVKVGSWVGIKTETVGTYDEATLDVIVRYAEQHNDSMIQCLIEDGYAIPLKKGMGAKVLHAKRGKVQVVLLSGREVWVLYNTLE